LKIAPTSEALDQAAGLGGGSSAPISNRHNCKPGATSVEPRGLRFGDVLIEGSLALGSSGAAAFMARHYES